MKVLVIGNAGFIGHPLASLLVSEGFDTLGLDIGPPTEQQSYPCLQGDIRNKEDLRRAADGADLIINLAAEHRDFGVSTEAYFGVNDVGTQNVMETASELGIERVVFFSSVAVYGPGTRLTEDSPLTPTSTYGESKVAGENQVRKWAAGNPRRQAVIVRPTVVFGPRNFGNMYNLIGTIARRRFVMVGVGDSIKSVAYVGNLVAATMFLISRMKPGLAIYNYSDYPQLPTRELVRLVCTALGRTPPRLALPLGPVLAAARVVDRLGAWTGYDFPITANRIHKFNTSTAIISDRVRDQGFSQLTSIEAAIGLTVDWYLRHGRAAALPPAIHVSD